MTDLYIVRHGNTFEAGETPRRIGARTDLPLTPTGRAQAQALGRHLAGLPFARALAGKLRRSRETAELLLGNRGPAVETAGFLTEIDHGPDEGRPEAEVEARLGREALAAWDQQMIPPPGWTADAEARLLGWHRFAATAGPGPILLVTSNGAARFALAAFGLSGKAATLKLRTGAYGLIRIGGVGGPELIEWDRRPE